MFTVRLFAAEVKLLFKMSAPMEGRLPSKETVNLLTKANICIVLFLFCLIYFPLNSDTSIDLIHDSLTTTKTFTGVISFYNLVVYIFLNGVGQHSTATTSKPTIRVKNFVKSFFILVLSAVFFHIIAVVFGAPLFEYATETFHLSMILTVTTVLPGLCVIGVNLSPWIRIYMQDGADLGAESLVSLTSVCSIIGAWLGAFPLPLDWDRPWQVWPISCVFGTIIGYIIGLTVGTIHMYYKYHKLRKQKIT